METYENSQCATRIEMFGQLGEGERTRNESVGVEPGDNAGKKIEQANRGLAVCWTATSVWEETGKRKEKIDRWEHERA